MNHFKGKQFQKSITIVVGGYLFAIIKKDL